MIFSARIYPATDGTFINCCRACYNRNSRDDGSPEESGGKSNHSEPRGLICDNNCKAKQVRDDEAMTESWRTVIKLNYYRSQ